MGQYRYLRLARLSDADQDRFPVPRFDPRRADRPGPSAVYGPGAARRDARDSRVAVFLFQKPDVRAETIPRARSVHSIDEAEEHAAPSARRRDDHAPWVGILRLTGRRLELFRLLTTAGALNALGPAVVVSFDAPTP